MIPADAGDPSSYLALEPGTAVWCGDGTEVGTVDAVIADEDDDIFDGLTVQTSSGLRFVEADMVEAIHERLVMLKISGADLPGLPDPEAGPGEFEVDGDADPSVMKRITRVFEGRFGDVWKRRS